MLFSPFLGLLALGWSQRGFMHLWLRNRIVYADRAVKYVL
jgi:hypothetical protein